MERLEGKPTENDSFDAHDRGLCLMAVMDHTGDFRLTWDPLSTTDVAKAKAEFNRLRKAGYTAYRLNIIDPKVKGAAATSFSRWDGELIMEFEELPQDVPSEVVMSPAMQGG